MNNEPVNNDWLVFPYEPLDIRKSLMIDHILHLQDIAFQHELIRRKYNHDQLFHLELSELSVWRGHLYGIIHSYPKKKEAL